MWRRRLRLRENETAYITFHDSWGTAETEVPITEEMVDRYGLEREWGRGDPIVITNHDQLMQDVLDGRFGGSGRPYPGETVLEEAKRVVDGDRQHSYGHPSDNHGCTAELWRSYIKRKHGIDIPIDAVDVCWMHILEKASRDANLPKRDNLVDTCGYARNAEMIREAD